jgi:hypothetical protein
MRIVLEPIRRDEGPDGVDGQFLRNGHYRCRD